MPLSFFSGRRQRTVTSAPEGTRIYAIGDIHGRADLLADMHHYVAADAAKYPDHRLVLVYLGDYVDRGLESKSVIDLLLDSPLPGFEIVHLMGNHEEMLLDFLDDQNRGRGWLDIGGAATLLSYGVRMNDRQPPAGRLATAQEGLKACLPQRHLEFLRDLRLYHSEGDYLFVHAGIRPGIKLEDQKARDLLWIRRNFLESTANHGQIVVHGHSVTWEPEVQPNRICIDTGAFATGVLTCLILDGSERMIMQTEA